MNKRKNNPTIQGSNESNHARVTNDSHAVSAAPTAANAATKYTSPKYNKGEVKSQTLEHSSRSTGESRTAARQTGASQPHADLGTGTTSWMADKIAEEAQMEEDKLSAKRVHEQMRKLAELHKDLGMAPYDSANFNRGGKSKTSGKRPSTGKSKKNMWTDIVSSGGSKTSGKRPSAGKSKQQGTNTYSVYVVKRKGPVTYLEPIEGDKSRKNCVSFVPSRDRSQHFEVGTLVLVKTANLSANTNPKVKKFAHKFIARKFLVKYNPMEGESFKDTINRTLGEKSIMEATDLRTQFTRLFKAQPKKAIMKLVNSGNASITGKGRVGAPRLSATALGVDGPRSRFTQWFWDRIVSKEFYPLLKKYAVKNGLVLPPHYYGMKVRNIKEGCPDRINNLEEFKETFQYPVLTLQLLLKLPRTAMNLEKLWKNKKKKKAILEKLKEVDYKGKYEFLANEVILTNKMKETYDRFIRELNTTELLEEREVVQFLQAHLKDIKEEMSSGGKKFSVILRDGDFKHTSSGVTWSHIVDVFRQKAFQRPSGRDQYVDQLILEFVTSSGRMMFRRPCQVVTNVHSGSKGDRFLVILLNNFQWVRKNVPELFTKLRQFFQEKPRTHNKIIDVGTWEKPNIMYMIRGGLLNKLDTLGSYDTALYSAVAKWLQEPGNRPRNLVTSTLRNGGLSYSLTHEQIKAGEKIGRFWRKKGPMRHCMKKILKLLRNLRYIQEDISDLVVIACKEVSSELAKIQAADWEFFENSESVVDPDRLAELVLDKLRSWIDAAIQNDFLKEADKDELEGKLNAHDEEEMMAMRNGGLGSRCSTPGQSGIERIVIYFNGYREKMLESLQKIKTKKEQELEYRRDMFAKIARLQSATPDEYEKRLAEYSAGWDKPSMVEHYWYMVDHGRMMRERMIDPRCLFWRYSPEEMEFAEKLLNDFDDTRKPGVFPHQIVLDLLPGDVVKIFKCRWKVCDEMNSRVPEDQGEAKVSTEWSGRVSRNANDPHCLKKQEEEAKLAKDRKRVKIAEGLKAMKRKKSQAIESILIEEHCESFGIDPRHNPEEFNAIVELVRLGWNERPGSNTPTQVLESVLVYESQGEDSDFEFDEFEEYDEY